MIVITDTKGSISYVNPKFTEVTGYSTQEIIGSQTPIFVRGNLYEEEYENLWNTITSGKEWRGEFVNKKKNGQPYTEAISISSIKNPAGNITHYVIVSQDITESKDMEQRLEEALEIKANFTTMVSHELRTPLTAIKEGIAIVLDEETENIAALAAPKTVKYLFLIADCKRGLLVRMKWA